MIPRIVVVGSLHVDLLLRVERLPKPGETVLGKEVRVGMGGKGANQAVAAARLGAKVWMVGRVGKDEYGRRMVENLRRNGVDTSHVREDERPSGRALILVDGRGENLIGVYPGADEGCGEEDVERARGILRKADLLLAQLEVPPRTVEKVLRVAWEEGTKTVLNLAPSRPLSKAAWRRISVLVVNEGEASQTVGKGKVGELAGRLLRKGPEAVIVTLGGRGAYLRTGERERRVGGVKVRVRDTTGAGDAFCGALAVGLASGKSLEEAVLWANCAGALATTRVGAQEALPSREEVDRLFWRLAGEKFKGGGKEELGP
ncbi:MAG: ribokinase [Candidatus Hadarchaeales archaeon]